MGTANLGENLSDTFFLQGLWAQGLSLSSTNPVCMALCFRLLISFCIDALHKWLCFPLLPAFRNFPSLPVHALYSLTKGFWRFSLSARPTFLHGGDPSGWQDGHCDPSRLKAALLWSNLLLSTTTTLQLMSCKSQRNCPKSCSKQHLTQAWREPQLREDRL